MKSCVKTLFCLSVLLVLIFSTGFRTIRSPYSKCSTRMEVNMSNQNSLQSFVKAGFIGLILSSPLIFTNAVVNAVEVEATVIRGNSAVNSVVTTSDEDRVKRKIELQKKANAGGKGDSYMDSLSREKEKVQGMKKSKSARSQDLCEVLGRGC